MLTPVWGDFLRCHRFGGLLFVRFSYEFPELSSLHVVPTEKLCFAVCLGLQHRDQTGITFCVNFLALEECCGYRFPEYSSLQSELEPACHLSLLVKDVLLVHSLPEGVLLQGSYC